MYTGARCNRSVQLGGCAQGREGAIQGKQFTGRSASQWTRRRYAGRRRKLQPSIRIRARSRFDYGAGRAREVSRPTAK